MSDLQAAWLGTWRAPWGLGRGRRWGDPAWALAAIAQAWLAGGKEGRWPRTAWTTRNPGGPCPATLPEAYDPVPSPGWVSLLRHGSRKLRADQRGRGESELTDHCWRALLEGDGAPWMALGTVLLDRNVRTRWIPVLGAVDGRGALQLPPFLDPLVPSWLRGLPRGWWAFLLARTDPAGRLLPEGAPPQDFPWALLDPARNDLEPFLLERLPDALTPAQADRWGARLAEGVWMLDPRVRAWGRGQGVGPEVLASLLPRSLALGDLPPGGLPPEEPSLPGGTEGYPPPETRVHPCADPFHWLEEGRRAREPEKALEAFRWAHAHFRRLGSQPWARRTAAEAARMALACGDLPAAESWRSLRGSEAPPLQALEEAEFAAARGEWGRAADRLRRLVKTHPLPRAWLRLAQGAVLLDRPDWMQEALPHLAQGPFRGVLTAILAGDLREPAAALDPEARLLLDFHRACRDPGTSAGFWETWEACPPGPLRTESALRLLEKQGEQRTPARLLSLRNAVERGGSAGLRSRLAGLWPAADPGPEPPPLRMVESWLQQRKQPTWLVWGPPGRPRVLGTGDRPPSSLLVALHENGNVEPMRVQGATWWGHALLWEGSSVGSVLTTVDPDEPMHAQAHTQLLAPWLARLAPAGGIVEPPSATLLLTDGSEPMAAVIADLARVAPSKLPVLILGPTGSGKELAAREIHARSGRRGPFWAINCSEYPETLLESELFGHEKGAYTGADQARKGALESAAGGTLLIDEVADLSPRLQSLFLRVLQEKEVRRVGSDRIHEVDVRFLAATHRSLDDLAASGQFRRDLLFRLKGFVLTLPALRERRHEFPYLVPRLAAIVAGEAGLEAPVLAPGLAQALARLPWPGNVRELKHALERALLRCGQGVLKAGHFPELAGAAERSSTWEDGTRDYQRGLLLAALRRQGFQATRAAQDLGLTRPALYVAARRLGLDLVAEREHWKAAQRQDGEG